MANNKAPVVSIVGRPNVGKSSLFNRAVGQRHAVVEAREGTTRDRVQRLVTFRDKSFILVDTGGFRPSGEDELEAMVGRQIEKAVQASDAILFICDGEAGLTPIDIDMSRVLRKSGKKIILAVNKIDNEKRKENILDFYELGLGEPYPVSCLHNLGIKELFKALAGVLPDKSALRDETRTPIKIAICGKPNVGKSSFLNKVLGEERVIVHEIPGTTRDSIDIDFEKDGVLFLLIDTAGIRHKRKVKKAVDVYSMMRSGEAIERCDVALLLIDAMEGVTNDDARIFEFILESGKGCVLIINKWDLVKNIEMSRYKSAVFKKIPQAADFPVVFVSSKTGRNVEEAFGLTKAIKTNFDLFIDKDTLKNFLDDIEPEYVKAPRKRRAPRFYGMIQERAVPKEFVIFVNDTLSVTDLHTAFIENRLRETFPLEGVPIKISYRRRKKQGVPRKGENK